MKTPLRHRRAFAAFLLAAASIASLHAVDLVPTWSALQQLTSNTASDSSSRVAKDASGNVFVAGSTNDGVAYKAFVQKRAAANGALVWMKTYVGQVTDIVADASGNVIVTGSTETGNSDVVTTKYAAADGAVLWTRSYNGGLGSSFDLGVRIAINASDDVAITGLSSDATSNYDFYTAKYAGADGALIWERRYSSGSDDEPQAIAFDSAGNVVVAGYSFGAGTGTDYYTAKYAAATGALLWERRYDSPSHTYDSLIAMKVDGSDNVVVTGGSGLDIYTARYAASNGAIQWEAHYTDPGGITAQGNAIAIDGSNNVFVGGLNGSNGWDAVTLKYNSSGVQQWARTYNGSASSTDNLYGVALDSSGNPVVSGQATTTTGSTDIYTAKYASSNGAIVWERIYDGPAHGMDTGYGMSVTGGGTVAITGPSASVRSDDDVYVALLNTSDGTPVWEQRYEGPFLLTDAVMFTKFDASGNVILAGKRNEGSATSGNGNINFYVAKRSGATGSLLWEQIYDTPSHNDDVIKGMVLDTDGNVIVTGESAPPGGGFGPDFFTVKYDGGTGAMLWSRRYDSVDSSYDVVSGVGVDASGNVFVGGSTYINGQYDWYVAKYAAADGAVLWTKTYNGTGDSYDQLLALTVDSAGDVVVGGYSGTPGFLEDLHTKKYAGSDGTLLWTRSITPASGYGRVSQLTVDASDNVCVVGANYTSTNGEDMFAAKYAAATGAVLWQTNYNGPGNNSDTAKAIGVDASGNVIVTGGSTNAGGNYDFYTVKYAAANGAVVWERRYNGTGSLDDLAFAAQLDSTGNVFVTGASMNATTTDFYTALYAAADGAILWEARRGTTGRNDVAAALAVDAENNIVVGGGSWSAFDNYYGGTGEGDLLLVKYAVTGPDISVEQPVNININDGGSRGFGSVILGSNSSLTFTIRNTGTVDLTGLGVTIDGTDAGLFTLTSSPTAPLTTAGTTTFTVRFAPITIGEKTAALHIASNDPNESPFDIALTGTGTTAPPTISDITNQTINEDTGTSALAFTIGDPDTAVGSLVVTAASNNTGVIANAGLIFSGSGSSRTLTVTPETNAFGSATITVTVDDGSNQTSDTFVVTVTSVNDAPTISDTPNQAIDEDTSLSEVTFNIFDVETFADFLTVTATSSNTALVPNANISIGADGFDQHLTITPVANGFGTTTITLTVSDGALSATDTFVLTVNSVNDVPTASTIGNRTIDEDGSTGAISITIGDVETAAGSLVVTGSSNDQVLVPNANIVFGGSGANRTVTITPPANAAGGALVTINVSDGQATNSQNFVLTVNPINDAPTVSNVADLAIDEDTDTGFIPFTVDDVETPPGLLIVTGTSSNAALVPNANLQFAGVGPNRQVKVTPQPNVSGTTTITLTASDGFLSGTDTFVLTVNAVNDAPTITDIVDQAINEDASTAALAFTIGDVETAAGSLTVSGTSSNAALVPNANIVFGGSGAARTVTVTPVANAFGTTTITVSVSDGVFSATDTFLLTVNSVNDAPTITDIADQSIPKNGATAALAFAIGDVETTADLLVVGGASTNTTLVPNANIVFGGSGAARTVTVTPAAAQFGSATITITVSDGVASATDTFVLAVTAPEIAVEQPLGTGIADGGTKGFGGVVTGATSSLVFTIRNLGNVDLTGLTIAKDGADEALFTITASPTAPVSGGGSTTFTVQFAPITAGQKTAALHIASNDDDEHPFDVALTGNGLLTTSQWRQQFFGTTATTGPFADNADFDHDGIANLIEYAFGLNPTLNSAGQIPPIQKIGPTLQCSFTEPPGVTGISYGAEWSISPAGPWTPVADTGIPPQHQFIAVTGANPFAFMRLKVTSP